MKTITYQTDKRHSSVIQKYGCLFKSIGYFSKKDISIEEQNSIWDMLVRNGAITGDLNGDGDVELKQLRSLKAIMSEATEEDEEIYNEIEAEIQAKREEIRGLEDGN